MQLWLSALLTWGLSYLKEKISYLKYCEMIQAAISQQEYMHNLGVSK